MKKYCLELMKHDWVALIATRVSFGIIFISYACIHLYNERWFGGALYLFVGWWFFIFAVNRLRKEIYKYVLENRD